MGQGMVVFDGVGFGCPSQAVVDCQRGEGQALLVSADEETQWLNSGVVKVLVLKWRRRAELSCHVKCLSGLRRITVR